MDYKELTTKLAEIDEKIEALKKDRFVLIREYHRQRDKV